MVAKDSLNGVRVTAMQPHTLADRMAYFATRVPRNQSVFVGWKPTVRSQQCLEAIQEVLDLASGFKLPGRMRTWDGLGASHFLRMEVLVLDAQKSLERVITYCLNNTNINIYKHINKHTHINYIIKSCPYVLN